MQPDKNTDGKIWAMRFQRRSGLLRTEPKVSALREPAAIACEHNWVRRVIVRGPAHSWCFKCGALAR